MGLDVASSLLQPIVDVLEGATIGDVKQEEPAHRVTVVSPGDGPAEDVKIMIRALNLPGRREESVNCYCR